MRYWHLFLLVSFSLSFSVLADSVFSESAGEYAQKGFHCELYDDAEEVYQCLEDFGNALLLPGSQADKEFKRELKEILIRHPKISRGYLNLISLSERFRFRVKDEEKRNGITGGNCLELDRLANSWKRYLQIKSVKAQMVQLANGMARLHANGLGENNFYFFGINVLRVCDLKVYADDGRKVFYDDHQLMVGVDFYKALPVKQGVVPIYSIVDSKEILEAWNSGDPIRHRSLAHWSVQGLGNVVGKVDFITDANKYRDYRYGVHLKRNDPGAILLDIAADSKFWYALNPNSSGRNKLRWNMMARRHEKRRVGESNIEGEFSEESKHEGRMELLGRIAASVGFSDQDRDFLAKISIEPAKIKNLYQKWYQRVNSTQVVAKVVEESVGKKAQGRFSFVARNLENCGVNVSNNHDISTMLTIGDGVNSIENFKRDGEEGYSTINYQTVHEEMDDDGNVTARDTTTFDMSGPADVIRDSSINLDQVSDSGVCVATSDIVTTKISLPKFGDDQLKAYVLQELIRNLSTEPDNSLL